MTYTVKLHHSEIALMIDALKKASARHSSYAKFYANRQQDRHIATAAGMTQLSLRLQKLVRD